jgi:hypothetical protein
MNTVATFKEEFSAQQKKIKQILNRFFTLIFSADWQQWLENREERGPHVPLQCCGSGMVLCRIKEWKIKPTFFVIPYLWLPGASFLNRYQNNWEKAHEENEGLYHHKTVPDPGSEIQKKYHKSTGSRIQIHNTGLLLCYSYFLSRFSILRQQCHLCLKEIKRSRTLKGGT